MPAHLPINVFCETSDGKVLIAQVANVRDVTLFIKPYNGRISWNMETLDDKLVDLEFECPDDLYEQILQRAKDEGITVEHFCRQVITDMLLRTPDAD